MRVGALVVIVSSAVLSGCSLRPTGPLAPAVAPADIAFLVQPDSYRSGDTIELFLLNESGRSIRYSKGLCNVTMERKEAQGWERVARQPQRRGITYYCPDAVTDLPSGGSDSKGHQVIGELERGVYRFRFTIYTGETEAVLTTNEFRVVR